MTNHRVYERLPALYFTNKINKDDRSTIIPKKNGSEHQAKARYQFIIRRGAITERSNSALYFTVHDGRRRMIVCLLEVVHHQRDFGVTGPKGVNIGLVGDEVGFFGGGNLQRAQRKCISTAWGGEEAGVL